MIGVGLAVVAGGFALFLTVYLVAAAAGHPLE